MSSAQAPSPLDGIRVLDLSRILAGPWCTQTLADLGAEVWKIENPAGGDDTRGWHPPSVGDQSTYYLCANRLKKSVAVDLRQEAGARLVRDLAAKADVLVENFRLGALAKYGLDYETLRGIYPRLIYCSISGYGRQGPMAARAGYDFLIQAESGLMAITGEPNGEPMKLGVAITDLVAGMYATQAVLAALIARGTTGAGQMIDMALLDGAVASLANVGSAYLNTRQPSARHGNAHASIVPYELFHTADGPIAVGVGNDAQFRRLCVEVLASPDLAADERFATNTGRVVHREQLVPRLNDAFKTGPRRQWMAKLNAAEIPMGLVRDVPEVLTAPEVTARGMVHELPHPTAGTVTLTGSPLKFSETPVRDPAAPPLLGQHTDEVLSRVLGLSAAEIERLRAAGAVA